MDIKRFISLTFSSRILYAFIFPRILDAYCGKAYDLNELSKQEKLH